MELREFYKARKSFQKEPCKENTSWLDSIVTNILNPSNQPEILMWQKNKFDERKNDVEKILAFHHFCKKVLKRGSYLITVFYHFMTTKRLPFFNQAGFLAISYSYRLLYRTMTVSQGHFNGFPQNVCQFAVIAKLPGTRWNKFSLKLYNKFLM